VKDRIPLITLGCLGCLAVVGIFSANQLTQLEANLAALIREAWHPTQNIMQTLTETVTIGTRKITVTTTKNADESDAQWIARHNAAINALQD
jgi:hypothetical protein